MPEKRNGITLWSADELCETPADWLPTTRQVGPMDGDPLAAARFDDFLDQQIDAALAAPKEPDLVWEELVERGYRLDEDGRVVDGDGNAVPEGTMVDGRGNLIPGEPLFGAKATEDANAQRRAELGLRTVREILTDPDALELPDPIVPKLVWPGRSTLFASREKTGKSTLATQAAAAVVRGGTFLDDSVAPGVVLWVVVEEHPNDVARRFALHGVAQDGAADIVVWDRIDGDPLVLLEEVAVLVSPRLVVVDTLAAFAREREAESGAASQWLPIVQGLTDIARRTDAGLLLLHHARKSDGRYRDSTAIGGGVDVIATMFEEKTPTERRIEIRGRYSCSTFTVNYEAGRYEMVGAGRTLPERICAFLRAAPESTTNAVVAAMPGRRDTILTTLAELVDRAVVAVRPEGQAKYYRLASDEANSPDEPVPSEPVPPAPYRGPGGGTGSKRFPRGTMPEPVGTGSGTSSRTGSRVSGPELVGSADPESGEPDPSDCPRCGRDSCVGDCGGSRDGGEQ